MISLEDIGNYGSFVAIIMGMLLIVVSGIGFGLVYYTMDQTQTAFESTDCVINNNSLVSTCQELWTLALYPFLNMKSILVWTSYFLIFGMVLGMLMMGYQSGKRPWMLGIIVLFTILLTYFGIEVSNMYRTLLENTIFRDMMVDFDVYNRVMLNFPWFAFIIGFASSVLGIVNFQKAAVNTASSAEELDF